MTRFKSFCILMLALTCCIWSTDAAIQKNLVVRENPVVVPNLEKSVTPATHQAIQTQNRETQEKLIAEFAGGRQEITQDKPVTRGNTDAMTKEFLRGELKKSSLNHSVVRNADGTFTAAIKMEKSGRGTGTLGCESVYDFSLSNDGAGSAWGAELGYDSGFIYCPAFYYDISLLPVTATVVSANVDFHFQDAPWSPVGPAYFDINDLFIWFDGTNFAATYDDIMNTSSGNTYGTETSGFTTDGTRNYVLNSQSFADIETQIAAATGWFGIGLDPSAMTPNGSWMMDPQYGLDVSILYVTYDAPGSGPVITSVTATPSTADNIGFGTITLETTWTHADDLELEDFGMILQYRAPWMTEVQLTGGVWEKTGTGAYRWYGEWDPPQDQQIGAYDVRFLLTDFTFTDEWGYTVNDDLFTITTPAIEYADFNDSGPLSQWPAGWTVNPATATDVSWQYDYIWTGTLDYIAAAFADVNAQNCTLTSPVVDMSSEGEVHFFFDCLYGGTPTNFAVEGSLDGFATVEESIELTTVIDADELVPLNWNITSWAAGQSNVQLRFRFVSPISTTNQAIVDVLQIVAGEAPITVGNTSVSPSTGNVIAAGNLTFRVDFTAATTATVDDFQFDLYVRSDAGLELGILSGLYNGDAYSSYIIQNSPGNFTAFVGGLSFNPSIEIGIYDLMARVSDGISWDFDEFDDNSDELTLITESFWYEDFNDTGAAGPADWTILSLPGGENGDDWSYEQYTGINDWFAFIFYDESTPPDAQNEVLRTATIDCSGKENLMLYYAYQWASGYDAAAIGQIRISNTNGTSWTTIHEHTAPAEPTLETGLLELDISEYADNQSQVKLEFRYTATDDYYWSIDILQIDESESLPIPTTGPIGIGLLLAGLSAVIVFRRK